MKTLLRAAVITLVLVVGSIPSVLADSASIRVRLHDLHAPLSNALLQCHVDPETLGHPRAVEVLEIYADATPSTQKQSAYDAHTNIVQWVADGQTPPGGVERIFEIRPFAQSVSVQENGIEVRQSGHQLIVTNRDYELTYQMDAGGTLVQIRYLASGRVVPVKMNDMISPLRQGEEKRVALSLWKDRAPTWQITSNPVETTLEIKARFVPGLNVNRNQWPQVIYRYRFFPNQPIIGVQVQLPAQELNPLPLGTDFLNMASAGESMQFFRFDFIFNSVSEAAFTHWVTGDFPAVLALPLTWPTADRAYRLSDGGSVKQWAAFSNAQEALGMIGPELGMLYEARDAAAHPIGRMIGHTIMPWSSRDPWHGETMEWSGYLYVGPSGGKGELVGVAARALHDYALTVQSPSTLQNIFNRTQVLLEKVKAGLDVWNVTPEERTSAHTLALVAQMASTSAREQLDDGGAISQVEALARWSETLATQAFRVVRHQEPPPAVPLVTQNNSFLAAATEGIALLFSLNGKTAELLSIFQGESGYALVRGSTAPRPLWELRFRDNQTRKIISLDSRAGVGVTVEIAPHYHGTILTLTWSGLTLGEEEGVVTVKALIVVGYDGKQDPQVLCRLQVFNKSHRYGLMEADYPIVQGVGKESTATEPDYLAIPSKSGMLIPNPGRGAVINLRYPGDAPIQLMGYWYDRHGLMVSTRDNFGFIKDFRAFPMPDGTLDLRMSQLVPDAGVTAGRFPKAFFQRYSIVLRAQSGDWYDMAKEYRKKAIHWPGCPAQAYSYNHNIPQWFKDCHLTYRAQGDPQSVMEDIEKFHQFYQMPAVVNWYQWQNVKNLTQNTPEVDRPLTGFIPALIQLQEKDSLYVVPYTMSLMWDTEGGTFNSENGSRGAVRQPDGTIKYIRYNNNSLAAMCNATLLWQRKLQRMVMQLLNIKFPNHRPLSGMYMDLGATGVGTPCYASNHGHATGGGYYYAQGWRKMLQQVRALVRERNPDFVMLAEGSSEVCLNQIDGYILFHSIEPHLMPINIPMFQAIYGDYIKPYGAKRWGFNAAPLNGLFPAQAFVFGSKIGRIGGNSDAVSDPRNGYFRKLAQFRKAAAKYLVYGEMLRPLSVTCVNPTTPLMSAGMAVQTTTWKASNKTVAFVFVNTETKPTTFRAAIDPQIYGLTPGRTLQRLYADGKIEPWTAKVGDTFEVTLDTYAKDQAGVLVLIAS